MAPSYCAMTAFVIHSRLMTQRQRHTIAALAIANIVIILALSVLVAPSTGGRSDRAHSIVKGSDAAHSTMEGSEAAPTTVKGSEAAPGHEDHAPVELVCQWKATQLLAQAGLGGKLTLAPDGPLQVEITTDLTGQMPRTHAPGGEPVRSVDEAAHSTIEGSEAAQYVWTAFDIALALLEQEKECATFTQVEVRILAHGHTTTTQISAIVNTADLSSFSAGELSEDAFIERVEYTSTAISENGLFRSE